MSTWLVTHPQPAPAPGAPAERASRALAGLRAELAARYVELVFDVDAIPDPPQGIVLAGRVLLDSQRRMALAAVAAAVADEAVVVDRIRVLASEDEVESWVRPRVGPADVLDAPDGRRETQVDARDPVARVLMRRREWLVVELADGTIGWSRAQLWREHGTTASVAALDEASLDGAAEAPADAPRSVGQWRAAWRGTARCIDPVELTGLASAWLGVPYLWGGTTKAGVDCSGLSQRLLKDTVGVGLPRHSLDQMRAGRRASPSDTRAGDLLVLTQIRGGASHVAVVVLAEPAEVVHACRLAGRVVREPRQALLESYRFRAARRFAPEGPE